MDKKTEKTVYHVAETLLIIGGLNWGLALFNMNLVQMLLGDALIAKIVYGAVGLSAIWLAWYKWIKK